MKRIILAFVLVLSSLAISAQSVQTSLSSPRFFYARLYVLGEKTIDPKDYSFEYKDLGKQRLYFVDAKNQKLKFKSQIELVNLVAAAGWRVVNFTYNDSGAAFLMEKQIKSEEDVLAGLKYIIE